MIVSDINAVKKVLTNLYSDMAFEDFETYIQDAEDNVSSEVLGSIIYDNIDDGSEADAKLKRLTEAVIILQAYEAGIPFMDLIQTNSGFAVISDKSKAPASKERVKKLIEGVQARLSKTLDRLIDYLEDTSSFHIDWKSSPAYSFLSDCLILTSREFKRYVSFEGSRAEFLLLKPTMINLTQLNFHPNISKAYINELISKQNAGTLSSADKAILPGLKQSLANFVLKNEMMAKRLLTDVVNILDNDLDSYPTYRDSAEKAVKDSAGFENLQENPIFVSP